MAVRRKEVNWKKSSRARKQERAKERSAGGVGERTATLNRLLSEPNDVKKIAAIEEFVKREEALASAVDQLLAYATPWLEGVALPRRGVFQEIFNKG